MRVVYESNRRDTMTHARNHMSTRS